MYSVISKNCLLQLVFLFLTSVVLTSVVYGISQRVSNISREYKNLNDTQDAAPIAMRLSQYYEKLADENHSDIAHKLEAGNLNDLIHALAVHRGLGSKHEPSVHYRLIMEAFSGNSKVFKENEQYKILDAGCGMGAAMLWFGNFSNLDWDIHGVTLAKVQYNFIKSHFPELSVSLSSYNQLPAGIKYSNIYAIESLWYSDWRYTLKVWGNHLQYGGRIAIIDDFAVNHSSANNDPDIQGYVDGWMLKAVTAVEYLCLFARRNANLRCLQIRDLTEEFDVNKYNYGNRAPKWNSTWTHQSYKGSYYRWKCSMDGLLVYALVSLEKF
jgi:hypothetical protein